MGTLSASEAFKADSCECDEFDVRTPRPRFDHVDVSSRLHMLDSRVAGLALLLQEQLAVQRQLLDLQICCAKSACHGCSAESDATPPGSHKIGVAESLDFDAPGLDVAAAEYVARCPIAHFQDARVRRSPLGGAFGSVPDSKPVDMDITASESVMSAKRLIRSGTAVTFASLSSLGTSCRSRISGSEMLQIMASGNLTHDCYSHWLSALKPKDQARSASLSTARLSSYRLDKSPEMNWQVKAMLVATVTMPVSQVPHRWQFVYLIYGKSIPVLLAIHCGFQLLFAHTYAATSGPNICMLIFLGLVAFVPLWVSCQNQLSGTGPTMALIHQMEKQEFEWSSMRIGTGICWACSVVFASAVLILYFWVYVSDILLSEWVNYYCVFGLCTFWVWPVVVCGSSWHVWFFARLHVHDILCYAGALAYTIEANDDADPMPLLQLVEEFVTSRLRTASRTWVRAAIWGVLICSMEVLILVSYLLMLQDDLSVLLSSRILMTFVAFIGMCALGVPVAHVAEVFEYDVLRALNSPLVVKQAQRHFGQQLLPHLRTLDWGFRLGGTVINMRLALSVGTASGMAIMAAVSQSLFDNIAPMNHSS